MMLNKFSSPKLENEGKKLVRSFIKSLILYNEIAEAL
jgi:hypothetical protein